jgi:hypothetical protein
VGVAGRYAWIVAPVAMLTPGVHAGSNGPLFYPPDELAHNAAAWDGKPVTVDHPPGGGYRPGATPTIGHVRNATYDGKLRAEAWLDPALMVEHAEELYYALENGGVLEVSTGLYTDDEYAPGVALCGVPYEYISRNYRPDHLAVLTRQPGACSVAAGCGLPVANTNPKKEEHMESPLIAPTMNFGNPAPHPAVGPGAPLVAPVMNFADDARYAPTRNAGNRTPPATASNATAATTGGETPLLSPAWAW